MADFDKALAYVLRHEGGWSDHPLDPGGATNYGITLKTAQRHGINSKAELKAMSQAKAAEIYRADYWRFDGINDDRVATKVFDMAVNMGVATAVMILQKAVGAVADGGIGPKTLAAVNAADPAAVLTGLCTGSKAHYLDITERKPSQLTFLKGWLKRAAEVPQ